MSLFTVLGGGNSTVTVLNSMKNIIRISCDLTHLFKDRSRFGSWAYVDDRAFLFSYPNKSLTVSKLRFPRPFGVSPLHFHPYEYMQ
jgi:hypothetical protein